MFARPITIEPTTISIKPDPVLEPLNDFPATLYLEGLKEGQYIWFAADKNGKKVLESEPHGDNTFIITIPELSATKPTTIYIFSDQRIPSCEGHLDRPDNWPAVYTKEEKE